MTEILLPILIVGGISLIAGAGLAIASVLMAVPTDEKYEAIRECLPGANCGACGYSGCDGYAAALASGETTKTGLLPAVPIQCNTSPRCWGWKRTTPNE